MGEGEKPLRILHLEDSPTDAELVRAFLHEEGIACEILRVESLAEFERVLRENGVDLIVSDFTLPTTDGLTALAVARSIHPDIPFIFLSGTIGEDVELATHLVPGTLPVKADPGQLEQAIMNLAVNSRDAMPKGGRLTIETRVEDLGEEYTSRNLGMSPGRYVTLTVSDTGEGIAAENLPFIFEPFFTTKEPGKGTGLGLAMVYGIVKQSGGHIGVSSERGRGTVFRIHLPNIEGSPEGIRPASESRPMPGGSETVLLVEDDDMVRAVTARMLRRIGYEVLEAPHPMLALQASGKHLGEIHLVVTDVVMPVIDGWEFVRRLRAVRPAVKALMMSGYPGRGSPSAQEVFPAAVYLPKPFSVELLAAKVREALDAGGAGDAAETLTPTLSP